MVEKYCHRQRLIKILQRRGIMAKFCGKCGSKLDEATGLCPNCDSDKLKKMRSIPTETFEISKQEQQKISEAEKPLSKKKAEKEDHINKKIAKKAKKKEQKTQKKIAKKSKRATMTTGKKVRRFFGKIILVVFLSGVLTCGIAGLLVYFDIVNIPQISQVFELMNIKNDNDSGSSLTALGKDFTDLAIVDEQSAISAVQEVADELGYQNAFDELKPYISTSVGKECFYRLQQYYKGIPVYGRYVTVVATEEGVALGMTSDAQDIESNISMIPQLSNSQMQSLIKEYAIANWGVLYDDIIIPELSDDLLVIYNQSDETKLAYKLTIINGSEYTVIADANTGEILEDIPSINSISSTGTNVDGSVSFPVEYDKANNIYTICDSNRGIYVYNLNKYSSKKSGFWEKKEEVVSNDDNIFGNTETESKQSPEIAINLLNNIELIADYYKTTFDQDIPYGSLLTFYNDGRSWGKGAWGGNMPGLTTGGETKTFGFLSAGYSLDCTEQDVLAHEYTHIVAREYDASTGSSSTSGAISEGLADTFACFFTDDWDIDLTVVGGGHRNAIDPAQYNYPASLNDKNKSGEDASHGYATVVSHAAFLMEESKEFTDNELQLLWYKTLLRLPHNCSFYDLRFCMSETALASGYSLLQRNAIEEAFDKVGVYDSEDYKCGNSITINVYDKQGNYYDDYSIQINGKTSGGFLGIGGKEYSTSATHQSMDAYNIELENGKYVVSITDNANTEIVKTFNITVKKSNSLENLYAFDFGADYSVAPRADLTFLDINGNTLPDYSAVAFYGDEEYQIKSNVVDLPETNYYSVLLSQRAESLGLTYYYMFSLRVKNGLTDNLKIPTNFEPISTQLVDTSLVPQSAVKFNDHYYYVYDIDDVTTWEEAKEYCESQGGYLATITSQEEDEFVYSYLRNNFDYESAYFGFTDQDTEGTWIWDNGETSSYTNWHSGEPNSENPNEDFAMYYYKYSDGSWNDGDFGNRTVNSGRVFICEWGEYQSDLVSQPQEPVRTTSDERDIVLVLDTSGSMSGTPMEETKKAATNFINTILEEDASIGVVNYEDSAEQLSDFSVDKNHLTEVVADISDGGGTNIESGLAEAKSMLDSSSAKKKIIVLMSDGEPNRGKEGDDLIAYADEIKNDDILIYTLGFFENMGGSKSSAQYLMEQLASDGCHYEVASADDLVFFFEDMADQINGQKYIYIRIACPVDVSVTYDGETLCSAEDDLNVRTDFGTLTFEDNENITDSDEDDRIKVLRLKEGADYDVQIVGTGRGMMDYTIGFMDENGDYSDLRRFEDVKISKRTVIDTVAAVSDESILNIDEDGDGKYDVKLRAEENGYGEEVKISVWLYVGICGGVVLLIIIALVVVKIRRRKKKGMVNS